VPEDQDRVWAGSMPQADALRLPFDDQTFDLIACQFGVMFFPDRPAAFREMRRVLAPAGRPAWAAAPSPRR
jgi:ubiquinone/menaquinone biosynthesis C-methylase UbiE